MGFFSGGLSGQSRGFFGGGTEDDQTAKLQQRLAQQQQVAQVAQVQEPPAILGALEKAIDVIGRPVFTIAGFTDELVNEGGNLGDAFKRAGRELFSGIGGLEGEKETFGDVLKQAGTGELGHVSTLLPFLFNEEGKGWKLKKGGGGDISGRGALGFGLDVALDPLTYLSSGTHRAATQLLKSPAIRRELAKTIGDRGLREAVESGTIPLTKKSVKHFEKLRQGFVPEKQREAVLDFVGKLSDDDELRAAQKLLASAPDELARPELLEQVAHVGRLKGMSPSEAIQAAIDVESAAGRAAHDAALKRIIQLADDGGTQILDRGGLKIFGKTLVAGERFKPATNRVSRLLKQAEKFPFAAQVASGARKLESVFNDTFKAARSIPGYIQAKTIRRAEVAQANAQLAKDLAALVPPGWKKATVSHAGREIPMHEYVIRGIDNPKQYPIEALPQAAVEPASEIRTMLQQWTAEEVRVGALDAARARGNYFPHMYRNKREDLVRLSSTFDEQSARVANEGIAVTDWREVRTFNTLDDAEAFTQRLKKEGVIDFDLDPIFDLNEVLARRGQAHNQAMATSRFERRMLDDYGLHPDVVADHTFREMFPEIQGLSEREIDRMLPSLTPENRRRVGDLLAKTAAGKRVSLKGLDDTAKTLYFWGRVRDAKNLDEVQRVLKFHKSSLASTTTAVLPDELLTRIGMSRRRYLASFNELFEEVKDGPFKGMYMPASLATDVTLMKKELIQDADANVMLKTYDLLTNAFKMGVTTLFPAFHVRNAYSNVAQNFVDIGLAALSPRRAGQAARLMAGKEGTMIAESGRRWTYDEIKSLATRFGVLPERGAILELQNQAGRQSMVSTKLGKVLTVPGNLVENEARMVNFMTWLERGLDPVEAAARTNRVLFDYGQLSPFERNVMRRLFPFYTWAKKNVALQARQLMSEPGRVLTTQKAALPNVKDSGPDRDVLPEYLRGDFRIKVGTGSKGQVFMTGIDLPFNSAINQIFGTNVQNTLLTNINNLNPFLTTTFELATGRDLWQGRKLEERQRLRTIGSVIRVMPKVARDWLEFEESVDQESGEARYDINGTKAHLLFKSWALSRMFSTAESFNRLLEQEGMGSAVLDLVTGLEFREFDMTEKQRSHLRARIKRLENELKRKGKVKSFERTFVPKGTELRQKLDAIKEQGKGGGFFG